MNRDNHEDVKLNNQINQEISSTKHICKYQSLEKLGIVSYIVFFVYTMLVFNFIAISDSITTGNTTYIGNVIFFLIIISLIVSSLGWAVCFYDIFKPSFHQKVHTSFWGAFSLGEESKKDIKKSGPGVIIIYFLLILLLVFIYPACLVVSFLAFDGGVLIKSREETLQSVTREIDKPRISAHKKKSIVFLKINPSIDSDDLMALVELTAGMEKEEAELFYRNRVKVEETYITRLDLSHQSIKVVPPEVFNLVNLNSLVLSSTGLEILPQEIKLLRYLEELDISNNKLSDLPIELAELSMLRGLGLSSNQLETFPPWEKGLPKLKILDLSHNKLRTLFDSVGELINLESLDLSDNQLVFLPDNLKNLTNLKELYLENNQLISIPTEISELENLIDLVVDGNPLVETDTID